jgi:hypothetical protein
MYQSVRLGGKWFGEELDEFGDPEELFGKICTFTDADEPVLITGTKGQAIAIFENIGDEFEEVSG